MKTLNLNDLDALRGVEWNEKTYGMRQITPRIASLIDAATAEPDDVQKTAMYYDAVALLLPTMPRDEVDNLSVPQISGIFVFAQEPVVAVEDAVADPNVERSAPETTAERVGT